MNTALLHNMSVSPRTQVSADILPLGDAIVRFDLAAIASALAEPSIWHTATAIAEGDPRALEDSADADSLAALTCCLDQAWQECGLQGAVHIYPWSTASTVAGEKQLTVLRATDPALVINVLARSRSQLLLPSMPLALESRFLTRELATDDPRLAELVTRTSIEEVIAQ